MYHGEWRERVRAPVAQERARRAKLTRGGEGASLGEGRRVKQRTVEKWLPPGAGRRNIKGNRLLVREVKNRPSPGHTRIAFIHLLYVLYHWSVIPFRRAAPRRTAWRSRDTRGITQIPPTDNWTGWHGLYFRNPSVLHTFSSLFSVFLLSTSYLSICDGILCIIYTTYRHQRCAAKSHTAASLE